MDLSQHISVATANERSVLDRRTMKITSTADVTLTNHSATAVPAPLHGVITILNATGPVTMPEALGGPSADPYFKYYYDLTAKLSGGTLPPGGKVTFSVKFVRSSTVTFRYQVIPYGMIPASNRPPVADAGSNQTIPLGSGQTSVTVLLNGSGSYDPDGTVVGYRWTGTPDPEDVVSPSINLSAGTYLFTLVVIDNLGAESDPASVSVTVLPPPNQAPTADAGPNRTVTLPPGQDKVSVQLNGSGQDPDGTIAAYIWSGVPDPEDTKNPVVSLGLGEYTFTLKVKDDLGAESGPSTVSVKVIPARPPVLSVSPLNHTIIQGQTLSLPVSASDPDGELVSLSASPVIPNASFSSNPGTTALGTLTFTPDRSQTGLYFFSIKARDPLGLTDAKTVQVTVNKDNQPPTLTAPSSLSVDEGKVLTFQVQAEDPNGDPVTLSASGLPANAVFIAPTGSLTFAPDYDQAGTYSVTFTASDGQLSSSKTTIVTVNDVPTGGPGQPQELTLQVDPVESPTFLTAQRITGTVNAAGTVPQAPRIKSALITGMSPTTGNQGQTLTVTLTGQAFGDYATHFASNVSKADFGSGITVNSVAVSGTNLLTAGITIAPDAAEGPRSVTVTTGGETAVSVLAFSVTKGKGSVTGRLVDFDTGTPITGATIALQGTTASAVSGNNGAFSITDIPAGNGHLIINPPDHEFLTVPVVIQTGQTADLGELRLKATVFDPLAPPSASVLSVTGRGIGDTTGRITVQKAKDLVKDTLLLIGGNEVGVLDEYGNQLNPSAKDGIGYVSLKPEGIRVLADQMVRGDTIELQELLFAFNFGLEWSDGVPMTLDEWIGLLQNQINAAWADPHHPDSVYAVVMFNRGKGLMPNPPQLSPSTRLSALQAYVFASSLYTYIFTREESGWGSPSKFWRNAFQSRPNYLMAKYREGLENYLQFMTGMAMMPILMKAACAGRLAIDLAGLFPLFSFDRFTPDPPKLKKADFIPSGSGKEAVKIFFERSQCENGSPDYLYSLWRFDGQTDERTLVAHLWAITPPKSLRELSLTDPNPPPGTHYYAMTLSKLFTAYETIPLDELQRDEPYWMDAHSGQDALARFRTTRRVTSDYSAPLILTIGSPLARVNVGNIELDPKGNVFYLPPDGKTFYTAAEEGTEPPVAYVDAGFASPGARGLAVDSKGNLFTDNAASDAQFGGRIFKFKPPTGEREFTGTINYFSQMLMFAHPTSAGPMAMAPDDTLIVVDQLSREIKNIAVNATYDPYRRVGQPIVRLVDAAVGEAFDMELDRDGNIYLLYLGLQTAPTAGIYLGPSVYLEVPKDQWDVKNKFFPSRKDGLVTAYGKTQLRVTAMVLDDLSRPLAGVPVEFSSDLGTFSSTTAVTDGSGNASTTLETLVTDHSAPLTKIEVRAYVPSLGKTYKKDIPVVDNLQALLDRYFREVPKGMIMQDGTYYTTPWGGISGPGGLNNLLSVTRKDLQNWVCEAYEDKVLNFLNKLRETDPYLLNGLEYGPTMALVGVHHNAVLWDKRAPNGWKDGLFLDPWINQTPEVYDFGTVRNQWFGIPIISDARPNTYKYNGQYPLTGGEFYPPKGTNPKPLTPAPQPTIGIVIDPKAPVYIEVENPEGKTTGFDGNGQLHGDIPGLWYYKTPDGKTVATIPDKNPHRLRIKGNNDGYTDVKILFEDGQEVRYDDVPIPTGVTAELIVGDGYRGQAIQFNGPQPPFSPTTISYTARIVALQPAQVEAGATVSVTLTGEATHFVQGVSQGIAAQGITVNNLAVSGPTTATADITVSGDLPTGRYVLSVQTGQEVAVPIVTLEVTRNE